MNRPPRYIAAGLWLFASVFLFTGCDGSNTEDTPVDDSGSPSEPANLRGVVYSSRAIELAWDAASDDARVVEYRIVRDDSLVATQSTLQYFENTLLPATTYTYQVQAVDDEGQVGEAATIDMTTLEDGPAISEANYSVMLPHVIDIANGALVNDLRDIVDASDGLWLTAYDIDELAGLTLLDQGLDPDNDLFDRYTYDCEFGGSFQLYEDNWMQFAAQLKGIYSACVLDDNELEGDFGRLVKMDKAPPNNEAQTSTYNLDVQNDVLGSQRSLTGQLIVNNSEIENRFQLSEANYAEHNLMWSTSISDIDVDVYATDEEPLLHYELPFSRTFTASFRLQGPQTGDEWISVSIDFATDDESQLNYQTGSLTLNAEDGSSMLMEASNGDEETMQLTFSQADSSTALTIAWTDEYRLKCFQSPTLEARLQQCE